MDVYVDECFDDEFDACTNCGNTDFFDNERDWDRVCTSCGATSCCEYSAPRSKWIPYYYKAENYFVNSIIHAAILKGAPIPQDKQEHLGLMFTRSVHIFHQIKQNIGRRNYPSYQYTLLKLCENLGIDVRPYITLPKMKATLDLVIKHWPFIDPYNN